MLIQQKFGWPNKDFRLNMGQRKFLLIQQNIFLGVLKVRNQVWMSGITNTTQNEFSIIFILHHYAYLIIFNTILSIGILLEKHLLLCNFLENY